MHVTTWSCRNNFQGAVVSGAKASWWCSSQPGGLSFWAGLFTCYKLHQAADDFHLWLKMMLKNLGSLTEYTSHLENLAHQSPLRSDFPVLWGIPRAHGGQSSCVTMATYKVVVMASKLFFLALCIFNSRFLVSEFAEFWPWFVSESWAACLFPQKCLLTIQARFLRYAYVGLCSVFAFII